MLSHHLPGCAPLLVSLAAAPQVRPAHDAVARDDPRPHVPRGELWEQQKCLWEQFVWSVSFQSVAITALPTSPLMSTLTPSIHSFLVTSSPSIHLTPSMLYPNPSQAHPASSFVSSLTPGPNLRETPPAAQHWAHPALFAPVDSVPVTS